VYGETERFSDALTVYGAVTQIRSFCCFDDPVRRRSDITLAGRELGRRPQISLRDGLIRTLEWYRGRR